MLHDVAKPAATQIADDGTISSKGHVVQGAKMAWQILWDLPVPFKEREAIASLVKYGSLPLWFWDKSNPERAVIKASQIIRCDMLGLLAEADVRGRYCNDQAELIERNATNLSQQLRGMLIRLFANYQGSIRIVYLETSWEELLRRNCVCTAIVPEKVLSRLKHRLDVPNITEAQAVDWVVYLDFF